MHRLQLTRTLPSFVLSVHHLHLPLLSINLQLSPIHQRLFSATQPFKLSNILSFIITMCYDPPPITSKGHLQPSTSTWKFIAEWQRVSICTYILRGIALGFLAEGEGHDENIVRIKVYPPPSPLSPVSTSPSTLSSDSFNSISNHFFPPIHPSYTNDTTSLTDSQIQQAYTFDEHIPILQLVDTSSINSTLHFDCVGSDTHQTYLSGIEDMGKSVQEMKGY